MKIVAISGYFDPPHDGHVEYFRLAKKLAGADGRVIAILNNDAQLKLKRNRELLCHGMLEKLS